MQNSYFVEHLWVAAYKNLKKQRNIRTHLKNDIKEFRFQFRKSLLSNSKTAILQYSCYALVVKIIAKYVKELIVNKASGLHTTALIKIELFDRYFFKDFVQRCRTAISLNISECLLAEILKNERTHRHIWKMTLKDFDF